MIYSHIYSISKVSTNLSTIGMRYEFFDFRFETSAKSCITTIPYMIQNSGILKIFQSPTALSPKSDGGHNWKYHQSIRHKILIRQIVGCSMVTRIYVCIQNRASIFSFPFINELGPGRCQDELNSQSDIYIPVVKKIRPTICQNFETSHRVYRYEHFIV